jgi:hypothetical protein
MIKSKRLRLEGNVARIGEKGNIYTVGRKARWKETIRKTKT